MVQTIGQMYIASDPAILGGEPIIATTRTPVRAVVEMWRLSVAPEAMTRHLPHLSLAQVFAALSYYSDHQAEINAHIERNRVPDERIDSMKEQHRHGWTVPSD
jgi:uncharacterized protein (DUF433 family)